MHKKYIFFAGFMTLFIGLASLWTFQGSQAGEPDNVPDAETLARVRALLTEPWFRPISDRAVRIPNIPSGVTQRPGPDNFGYDWDDSFGLVEFRWIEISETGTQLFPYPENPSEGVNDVSEMVSIGFNFPFYEFSYTEAFIADNGILTFGEGTDLNDNREIPRDAPPNNFIAGFWDDLEVGGDNNPGKVYYWTGVDIDLRTVFVVTWNEVAKIGVTSALERLSFQIILYENGDIRLQYQNVDGVLNESTSGIENADGTDGIEYAYNEDVLDDVLAVYITRPNADPSVKAFPKYQSHFLEGGGWVYPLEITNVGREGVDVFDLTYEFSGAMGTDWDVTFLDSNGFTPLTDTDGDQIVDVGPLQVNNSREIVVRLQAPNAVLVGDNAMIEITAASSIDTAWRFETIIHGAIAAPHIQVFVDSASGINVDRIFPTYQSAYNIIGGFNGSVLGIEQYSNSNYLLGWELSGTGGGQEPYEDIEFVVLDDFGEILFPAKKLTDNEIPGWALDKWFQFGASPDGGVAITWVRTLIDTDTFMVNSNVYLAILDDVGDLTAGPINVTKNTDFGSSGSIDVPTFTLPTVIGKNDRYVLMWTDRRLQPGGEEADLATAIYSSSGSEIQAPSVFKNSVPGGDLYTNPTLLSLTGNRIMVVDSRSDNLSTTFELEYGVMNQNGSEVQSSQTINNTKGTLSDSVKLLANKILIAWENPSKSSIDFVTLNDNGTSLNVNNSTLDTLTSPDNRDSFALSVTTDKIGNGIIVWMDLEVNARLYYALVDPAGSVVTRPMVSRTGAAATPFLWTSILGQGIAPLKVNSTQFLPVMQKD